MPATFHVLQEGMAGPKVRSTVSLVIDGDHVIVIDPGMAPSQSAILDPLRSHGIGPTDVTDVIISHHHPDHTVNVGLFGEARVHDYWATYHFDTWTSRSAEGFEVSPWTADGPEVDPRGTNQNQIEAGRARVLAEATLIVPGHGPVFQPDVS